MRLKDKAVIVTGSSMGIGEATARLVSEAYDDGVDRAVLLMRHSAHLRPGHS